MLIIDHRKICRQDGIKMLVCVCVCVCRDAL